MVFEIEGGFGEKQSTPLLVSSSAGSTASSGFFGFVTCATCTTTSSRFRTIRFSELSRAIPDISTRVLSGTLRTLEADDLIVRKVYTEIPPRVEYSLTPMGKEQVPIVQELTAWASKNLPTIMKHRQQFEE